MVNINVSGKMLSRALLCKKKNEKKNEIRASETGGYFCRRFGPCGDSGEMFMSIENMRQWGSIQDLLRVKATLFYVPSSRRLGLNEKQKKKTKNRIHN